MATDMGHRGRLAGKVAVITGSGRGLGRAGARLFAGEGASVVVADLDQATTAMTVEEIETAGGTAVGVPTDVSDEEQIERLISAAVEAFGGIDIMWNNAGIAQPGAPSTAFEDYTTVDWQRQIRVNLDSVYYGCKHAVAPLRARGGGSIINTSSAGSLSPPKGWVLYSAVKGGVNAMTRALAVDLGQHNIRVNAMAPSGGMGAGFMGGPGGRGVEADDALAPTPDGWTPGAAKHVPLAAPRAPGLADHAGLALYLASDDALYMTGQVLVIDGGRMVQMPPAIR